MANTVSPLQVASMLYLLGIPQKDIAPGVAIAGVESSYDPTQRNNIGASGLFQILESAHPEFKAQWTNTDWDSWKDPLINTAMAVSVYKTAGGWAKPWKASYQTPRYYELLPAAQQAATQVENQVAKLGDAKAKQWAISNLTQQDQNVVGDIQKNLGAIPGAIAKGGSELGGVISATGPAVAQSIGEVVSDLQSISDFFGKLLLPSTWMRVGAGIAGILLIAASLFVFGKEVRGSDGI